MKWVAVFVLLAPLTLLAPSAAAQEEPCEDDDGWHVEWVSGIFLPSDSSIELTSVIIYLVPDITTTKTFTFFANALCLIPLVDMECLVEQATQPSTAAQNPRDCLTG